MLSLTALAISLFLAPTASAETKALRQDPLDCAYAPRVFSQFAENHLEWDAIQKDLERRVGQVYLDRLDPSRSMFLEAEAQALEPRIARLYREIAASRCDDLDALHQEILARHRETEAFVKALVGDPKFALDRTVSLEVDPDKRPRPRTPAERDELRRKLVQFQFANYVAAGTSPDEARKKLAHRYELTTKRLAKLDAEDRLSGFLDAVANALDPHSSYFSAEALDDFTIGMRLSLEGIGAVLRNQDGYTIVSEVVPGGAADRQGTLRAKDKIIAVAQGERGEAVNVVDEDLRDVVRIIRGPKGSKVRLTVLRQGEKTETLSITITRDKVDLSEQAVKLTWHEVDELGAPGTPPRKLKLAYIDLPSFYGGNAAEARQCTDDMRAALREAKAKQADGVVLDLSRNGGGLLNAAVEIAGMFLSAGEMVGVAGKNGRLQPLEDRDADVEWSGPLVVLISRASASASEIVSGALKDYRRAIIIGDDHTYGKGTVQNVEDLAEGYGAVKVTTAMFFRPGGESTQNLGVDADIVLPSVSQAQDWGEKTMPFALPPARKPAFMTASIIGQGFEPVTAEAVTRVARQSAERVQKSEEFDRIRGRMDRQRRNKGMVTIADLLSDAEEDRKRKGATGAPADSDVDEDEDEDEARRKRGELTPHGKEALNVLAAFAGCGVVRPCK